MGAGEERDGSLLARSINGAVIRECINNFGVINSRIIPRVRDAPRLANFVRHARANSSPRTCSTREYTCATRCTYVRMCTHVFPRARVSHPEVGAYLSIYLPTYLPMKEGTRACARTGDGSP